MIKEAYEYFRDRLSPVLGWDVLKIITRYHRLQGSAELWEAVKELAKLAEEKGFKTKIFKVEPGSRYGFMDTPVSWDPIDAKLELKTGDRVLARYKLSDHPTLLAAHSPGGEGCAELSVCKGDDCKGEAVLVHGYIYDLYLNVDANLIIYYDENRYPEAFPYTGIFIRPGEEVKRKTIMTLPYRLASRLIDLIKVRGRKITVCWKADVKYHDKGLPVLIAYKGDDPGVLFISHICHPKPGAHDNASGSVANLIVLDLLSKANSEYSYSSCHVWVPEYSGTIFLSKYLPWRPRWIINLDMVGSKQHVTGSTMVVVNPPRYISNRSAAALWFAVSKVFDTSHSFNNVPEPGIKYGISPYTLGSDHDVFVGWGYDATMLNEWPSKYYHTDMDDVNGIDKNNLALTGLAATLAGYLLIKYDKWDLLEKTYESIIRDWYRVQAFKKNFSLNYLTRYLVKKPVVEKTPEKPLLETPITSRTMYRVLGREKYLKLVRQVGAAYTYLGLYAGLAEKIGIREHIKHYKAELLLELNRKEEKILVNTWEEIKSSLRI